MGLKIVITVSTSNVITSRYKCWMWVDNCGHWGKWARKTWGNIEAMGIEVKGDGSGIMDPFPNWASGGQLGVSPKWECT